MSAHDVPPVTPLQQDSPKRSLGSRVRALRLVTLDRGSARMVDMNVSCTDSPELIDFLADAEALARRIKTRNPESREEITALLQGAINAARTTFRADGVNNLAFARGALRRAEEVFYREVQTKNRIFYVMGLGIGVCTVVLVPILLIWIAEAVGSLPPADPSPSLGEHAKKALAWLVKAAPFAVIAPLFFFAGLGASASVLSRLTTIDLREETSRTMVLLAAASRPALAVIFASVIFVILKNGIINVGADPAKQALIWVAAFLCGYSERFASDILDRVPLGGSTDPKPVVVQSAPGTAIEQPSVAAH